MSQIRTVLGTMAIGGPLNKQATEQVLELFSARGHKEIDGALMYQDGKTDRMLGILHVCTGDKYRVATKVNPWFLDGKSTTSPQAGLNSASLKQQVQLCCSNLQTGTIPLLYLHAPDHQTPINETLETLKELYQKGKFKEWGLSNFASWQVVDIYYRCKQLGLKPPSVYQGMYNYVARLVEPELFPALRALKMSFYAYNPLAGGILTGRYQFSDDPQSGRFSGKTVWGGLYRDRFWHETTFQVLDKIKQKSIEHNLTETEVALAWLYHHSQLSADCGDGVIIGGSSIDHIKSNLDIIDKLKPLPKDIFDLIDEAWIASKPHCQSYFR